MTWKNGNVLVAKSLNNKEIRFLVQDGYLTVQADGAVIGPEAMKNLAYFLLEGADALTQD